MVITVFAVDNLLADISRCVTDGRMDRRCDLLSRVHATKILFKGLSIDNKKRFNHGDKLCWGRLYRSLFM